MGDRYGTERLKDNVPIDVEQSGNPPFWSTEIEKLPTKDPMNPIYYPLSQCLFVPSRIENALEMEHCRARTKFNKELEAKGWGNMLYRGCDDGDNMRNKNVKYKRKRKRKLKSDTDTDLEILEGDGRQRRDGLDVVMEN